MGAWGYGIFDDDGAMEYWEKFQLAGSPISMLVEAFTAVLEANGYMEDNDEVCAVFVAAEIAAALIEHPSKDFLEMYAFKDETTTLNIENLKKDIPPGFFKMALDSLTKANNPEQTNFAGTWEDSEERDAVVQDLFQRLRLT